MHLPLAIVAVAAPLLLAAPAGAQESATRPGLAALRATVWASVDAHGEELKGLSNRIWRFAETSLKENRSSEALAAYIEQQGFTVERGVADIPTAFVARYGEGKPVVGILAEFDALPGISNRAVASQTPLSRGSGGHGCGHNLFAAGSAGAAVAAKEALEAHGLSGTIVLFGCPAEETVIGKVYMAKAGVFDGLDVCLDWHPSTSTGADFSRTRALNNWLGNRSVDGVTAGCDCG
jgi:aminobenzoyl-glutamate utilization protein B